MSTLARKIDWHHVAMQGTFFFGFGALMSYGSVLMLSRGLSNSALGVVTCIAQLMPMVMQPIAANLTEKYNRLTPRRMILILGALVFAASAVMMCFSRALWVTILGYIFVAVAMNLILPFFNIIMVSYLLRGVEVNFGLGRGAGAGMYALSTLVVGFLLEGRDPIIIVPIVSASIALQFASTLTFRYPLPPLEVQEEQREEVPVSRMALMKQRPDFVLMMLASSLLIGVHNVTNVYMVHVVTGIGGTEKLLGIVVGVATFMEMPAMPLMPKFAKKIGVGGVLRLSGFFFILRLVLMLVAKDSTLLYVAALGQFFSSGMLLPATVYYAAEVLSPVQQTNGQSLIHLFSNCLGPAVLSLIVGAIVDWRGIGAALVFMIGCAIIGTGLTFISTRNLKKEGSR